MGRQTLTGLRNLEPIPDRTPNRLLTNEWEAEVFRLSKPYGSLAGQRSAYLWVPQVQFQPLWWPTRSDLVTLIHKLVPRLLRTLTEADLPGLAEWRLLLCQPLGSGPVWQASTPPRGRGALRWLLAASRLLR